MREKSNKGWYSNSTMNFSPSSMVTKAQSLYEWSVRSEERKLLTETQKNFPREFLGM